MLCNISKISSFAVILQLAFTELIIHILWVNIKVSY